MFVNVIFMYILNIFITFNTIKHKKKIRVKPHTK